jgi:all-trans-retinol dehydrogenase (NAD+)
MKSLKGLNILITGAASGIGREMARLYAKERANLALVDINEKNLETTLKDLDLYGVKARGYKCDVSNRDEIDEAVATITKDFGQIDILVNNAGIVNGGPAHELDYAEVEKLFKVNVLGGIWLVRQILPDMMKRNSGHIVNVASAMGLAAAPLMSDYTASKFAMVGFTETIRIEMKKFNCHGVKVTCICPGAIDTGLFEGYKPPLLTPVLKPITVAEHTIMATKKNKPYVILPFMLKFVPLMKGVFPTHLYDWIVGLMGNTNSMDILVQMKQKASKH